VDAQTTCSQQNKPGLIRNGFN